MCSERALNLKRTIESVGPLPSPLPFSHCLQQATSAPASPFSPPDVVVVEQASPPQQPIAAVGPSGEMEGGGSSSSSGSPSPGVGAAPDANGFYEEEGEDELEMHSKAFHTIGELQSLRDSAKSDRRR